MAAIKSAIAVAAMVACLAIIYPRLMHPLVLRALGMPEQNGKENVNPESQKVSEEKSPPRGAVNAGTSRTPTPHLGVRAAADMQKQQASASGRGIMGFILPIYAVGIVVYLVYTLFKVFNKSKKDSPSQDGSDFYRRDTDVVVDKMGFPLDFDGSGDVHNFLNDCQHKKELEDILSRVNNQHVSVDEMRLLQSRLEETEAQMSRILMAMQKVQTNVDRMGDEEDVQTKPTDLSPDMESYEVVGRPDEMDLSARLVSSAGGESKKEVEANKLLNNSKKKEVEANKLLNNSKKKEVEANKLLNNSKKKEVEANKLLNNSKKMDRNVEVDFDGIDKDSDEEDYCSDDEDIIGEEVKKNMEDASNETIDANSSSVR